MIETVDQTPARTVPTINDVARAAGVSRTTVSRVLNGGVNVAKPKLEAVQTAIEQLGYQPNLAARGLVTRRLDCVAVIVPEANERVFSDPFFAQAHLGALSAFAETPVQVVLVIPHPDDEGSRMIRYLHSGHVDGAIVMSHHGHQLAESLVASSPPVVFVGHPGVDGCPYVDLDNLGGGQAATRHLIEGGATRLATVTGPLDMGSGVHRLRGFEQACAEAGLTPLGVEEGDYSTPGGVAATQRLLAACPDLDGLFVANDLMAAGAIRVLARSGRRVPDDVRVVGFDDSIIATQTNPTLTTITNGATELARLAGTMLLQLLDGERPESPVILPSELVRRGSA